MSEFDPDGLSPAQLFLRFFHLEKLPVARRARLTAASFDSATRQITGLDANKLADYDADFRSSIATVVQELLHDERIRRALDSLPLERNEVIVAIGDSITDDVLSWANLLAELLAAGRPDLELTVLNYGFTADTTKDVIARFDAVLAQAPNWILQLIGTNDARRHTAMQVQTTSLSETSRNLDLLRRLSVEAASARFVAITPPPVDEARANGWQPFHAEQIAWQAADVRAIAELVARDADSVDIYSAFIDADDELLLLADGIHPTLAGQLLILRTLLDRLGSLSVPINPATEESPHHAMTERSIQ